MAPVFTKEVSATSVMLGKTLVLEGVIDGEPRPIVQWFRNQEELLAERYMCVTFDNFCNKLLVKLLCNYMLPLK